MNVIYGRSLNDQEFKMAGEISLQCDISFDTARLLLYRNIDTVEKAKAYFNAGKNGFNDPLQLNGVKEAVLRIIEAKEKCENVLVFGDYDADGICASTVLDKCLKDFGIKARIFVPEREEGYGLNVDTVKNLYSETPIDLLITVDCGISDREKIEELKGMGIDVIVTDHHEPPKDLPECICINPKIEGQEYPFDGLCGAGVAYKLGYALIGNKANDYLDFVALATVADSMDLISENRDIVVEGLKLFNNPKTLRMQFRLLMGDSSKQISAQTIMYSIAPRVNAGGRMGDAKCALKLFAEDDERKAFDLAAKLGEYNLSRQGECDGIYKEAKEIILKENLNSRSVILVGDENWKVGFVGIVASRLVEEFARPVIVFAGHDGNLKGSARSVDGINIHDALTSLEDMLIAYGGHAQAAGVTISKENFSLFYDAFEEYVNSIKKQDIGEKVCFADMLIDGPISIKFAREIEAMEPFGVGNRRPLFATKVDKINSLPLKNGSAHYSYKTKAVEMLDFNGENNVKPLALPLEKTILFELNLSSYKNRESLKGYVRYVELTAKNTDEVTPFVLEELLEELKDDGKIDKEFLKKINFNNLKVENFVKDLSTDRSDFARIFNRLLGLCGKPIVGAASFAYQYFDKEEVIQAVFAIKVFIELGIFDIKNGYLTYRENIKNALTNSKVYSKIYAEREAYVRNI